MIKVQCTLCEKVYEVDDAVAGKTVRCRTCGAPFDAKPLDDTSAAAKEATRSGGPVMEAQPDTAKAPAAAQKPAEETPTSAAQAPEAQAPKPPSAKEPSAKPAEPAAIESPVKKTPPAEEAQAKKSPAPEKKTSEKKPIVSDDTLAALEALAGAAPSPPKKSATPQAAAGPAAHKPAEKPVPAKKPAAPPPAAEKKQTAAPQESSPPAVAKPAELKAPPPRPKPPAPEALPTKAAPPPPKVRQRPAEPPKAPDVELRQAVREVAIRPPAIRSAEPGRALSVPAPIIIEDQMPVPAKPKPPAPSLRRRIVRIGIPCAAAAVAICVFVFVLVPMMLSGLPGWTKYYVPRGATKIAYYDVDSAYDAIRDTKTLGKVFEGEVADSGSRLGIIEVRDVFVAAVKADDPLVVIRTKRDMNIEDVIDKGGKVEGEMGGVQYRQTAAGRFAARAERGVFCFARTRKTLEDALTRVANKDRAAIEPKLKKGLDCVSDYDSFAATSGPQAGSPIDADVTAVGFSVGSTVRLKAVAIVDPKRAAEVDAARKTVDAIREMRLRYRGSEFILTGKWTLEQVDDLLSNMSKGGGPPLPGLPSVPQAPAGRPGK